jgi:hypothetical protein
MDGHVDVRRKHRHVERDETPRGEPVGPPHEEPETSEDLEETAEQDEEERGRQPGRDDGDEPARPYEMQDPDRDHRNPANCSNGAF